MNNGLCKNVGILGILGLFLVSCSDSTHTRYKDTSALEAPPRIKIVRKTKTVKKDEAELNNTGLGKNVVLEALSDIHIIKIKKLFDRSWNIVEQSIKLNEIEITDKNREQGIFYVLYDPESEKQDNSSIFDTLTFSIFENNPVAFEISVVWQDNNTEVTAKQIIQENELLDDEDNNEWVGTVDDSAKLIKTLFKTIRDDLPIN